ncbi:MAG: nitrate reductase [Gemmataceae bacterium]
MHPLPVSGETICPYCGVGCRLRLDGAGASMKVRGVESAAANLGRICAKGALLGPTVDTPDRLRRPLVRRSIRDDFREVGWDEAIDHLAERFTDILFEHGPAGVAFYGSGQLDTEAVYAAVKLFKGTLGCNNTDSNSRLCMAAAVTGYRTSLGADGPPCCYDDIDHADLAFVIGSNMAEAHPVTFDRLREAKKARPLTLVVADPRRTATADLADLHIAVKPGGDIALLNAVGIALLQRGAVDRKFVEDRTNGFDAYRLYLEGLDPAELHAAAGVSAETVHRFASMIANASAFLSFYCMGLNQSTVGLWKNNSLINLHLLTGQIGRPGAGPFSLTGQPNAMGGREAGLLASALPGYRTVDRPDHRAEVEAYWGRVPGTIAPQAGLTAVEMFRAMEQGRLPAVWIAATNPAVSLPDLHQVQRGFGRAKLIVVSDAYHPTETTRLAHVVLPAAQWGEKEWTSTNSERMVSFSPRLFDPPGDALSDWQILAKFARRIGLPGFDWRTRDEVWDEFVGLTNGRPCDMAGMTADRLRRDTNVQWPCPSADHPGTKRLYVDTPFPTADGRAVFLPRDHRDPTETPDHEFPLVLTTGRLYAHWHTLTRTAKCDKLVRRDPGPYVEVHPHDAAAAGLADGDPAQLSTRRGTVRLPVRLSDRVSPGLLFVPFHWGDLYGEGNAANYLTISATGRVAKQPELKFCAVALAKVPTADAKPRPYLPYLVRDASQKRSEVRFCEASRTVEDA